MSGIWYVPDILILHYIDKDLPQNIDRAWSVIVFGIFPEAPCADLFHHSSASVLLIRPVPGGILRGHPEHPQVLDSPHHDPVTGGL